MISGRGVPISLPASGIDTFAVPLALSAFIALSALLVLAGCIGPPSGAGVPSDEARERALSAEEDHLSERLRDATCLEDWGVGSGTVVESATVENRTDHGVHVRVTHPYWYEQGHDASDDPERRVATSHADAVSEATYRVSPDATTRLQGTTVGPC